SHPDADLAVLFTHNSGYSTMCGHATIAIGRWAVEHELVPVRRPLTTFNLECPCGVVRVTVEVGDTGTGAVTFESVPAFASHLDLPVATQSVGRVDLDIAFGGAFYAILPASRIGLSMHGTPLAALVSAAREITTATRAQVVLEHPDAGDLAFLYGTILTDDSGPGDGTPSLNLCIFGEGQVDRSPTGSGVTARLALDHARSALPIGGRRTFRGLTGEPFTGELLREARAGNRPAVIARGGGRAYYTGTASFLIEADDPLPDGFPMPQNPPPLASPVVSSIEARPIHRRRSARRYSPPIARTRPRWWTGCLPPPSSRPTPSTASPSVRAASSSRCVGSASAKVASTPSCTSTRSPPRRASCSCVSPRRSCA